MYVRVIELTLISQPAALILQFCKKFQICFSKIKLGIPRGSLVKIPPSIALLPPKNRLKQRVENSLGGLSQVSVTVIELTNSKCSNSYSIACAALKIQLCKKISNLYQQNETGIPRGSLVKILTPTMTPPYTQKSTGATDRKFIGWVKLGQCNSNRTN